MVDHLDGVHPGLKAKITQVLTAMAALGYPMKVVQGVRTAEQQQDLYAQGRSLPGKIVTNCDGFKSRSNHQVHPDTGYGQAVDCAFCVGDPFGEQQPWSLYGACVKAVGLKWGGDFVTVVDGVKHPFPDRPHAELA